MSKDKEETRVKDIRIRRPDNNEIIGSLNVSITYKKAEYEKIISEKPKFNLQVTDLSADFGKADISKI